MSTRKLSKGINVDKLDQLVKDLGVRVRLYKSTLIPNMTSLESMDQDLNSSVGNNNMIDFDPTETIAMFQQQDLMEQFKVHGTFHLDEVLVSFLSGQTLAPFAKIEILDFEEDFYELVQRQEGTDIDNLKYAATCSIGVFTATTNSIERYYEGTDYKINQDGNIEWTGSHRPAARQIYSIYYRYHPIYRAVKAVHRDRFSQFNDRPQNIKAPKVTIEGATYVKMPETWVIKRDYLLERDKNELYDPNE